MAEVVALARPLDGADLGRFRPMVCERCTAVGTIVEMGLCCKVKAWNALGPMWDIPDWRRLKGTTCKRPGKRGGSKAKGAS